MAQKLVIVRLACASDLSLLLKNVLEVFGNNSVFNEDNHFRNNQFSSVYNFFVEDCDQSLHLVTDLQDLLSLASDVEHAELVQDLGALLLLSFAFNIFDQQVLDVV